MTYAINTHDCWGIVNVGKFQSLEEAKIVFKTLCDDPWYRNDGMVRGVELVQDSGEGELVRIDWLSF